MSEQSSHTTSNGYEIQHPREVLSFSELQAMTQEYGIAGSSPAERAESLRKVPHENVVLFMSDINRRLQGSDETLVHERVMKIGEKELIDPSDRLDIFLGVIDAVQQTPEDINPARIGDTLAMAVVMLHPFKDGNGRTARIMGFMFREDYDTSDAADTFSQLAESRDIARERGGFLIYGYVPSLEDGFNQADPIAVGEYLNNLTKSEDPYLYTGPYGQSDLRKESVSV
jgi:prophage maintenance system killer protein